MTTTQAQIDFSGEYRIECILNEHAVAVGLSDKPCWKISGPKGLEAIAWNWNRDPGRVLYDFLRALDLDYTAHTPVVFAIKAST